MPQARYNLLNMSVKESISRLIALFTHSTSHAYTNISDASARVSAVMTTVKKKTNKHAGSAVPAGQSSITDIDVSNELSASFLEYAMSVIVARALPDVRDGLKPVHRRILYSLYSQNIKPNSPYKKCARVVGDTMGKYHPHGDSAIYEALVRLAQSWSMRLPLVDGHGNFGSLDDGPAASRYTECRMSYPALSLVDELYEDTVNMRPNYDGNETEPEVLPAAFPNLLVNGSTGIAVGMATNMPPHNIGEVIEGLIALLDDKNLSLYDLMKYIPGPDLPSGGIIFGLEGIKEAYITGRGSFTMRAVVEIEELSGKRKSIVVKELPYTVGPEKVVARIKELVSSKKLLGISDIKDYSDRKSGLRLVIECKNGFNPNSVLSDLYKLTPLQENFAINNVALVNGAPETLGLLALCHHYLNHRTNVVKRRSQYRLAKCQAREHILKGLLVALVNIDAIVKLIRSSENSGSARVSLMKKYKLSEVQAEAILEMALRRLTSLEVNKIEAEIKELEKSIEDLLKILGSDKVLKKLVAAELSALSKSYSTPRRSTLTNITNETASEPKEEPASDEPCIVALSAGGLVARFDITDNGKTSKLTKHDLYTSIVRTNTNSTIGLVTSKGTLHRVKVSDIPVFTTSSKGIKASLVFTTETGDSLVGLLDVSPDRYILIGTTQGNIKKTETSELPSRLDARAIINLKDKELVANVYSIAKLEDSKHDVTFVTSDAQLIRFSAQTVSPKGIGAGSMTGIKLSADCRVVNFSILDHRKPAYVVTVSDAGAIKVSDAGAYPIVNRGGKGVRCMKLRTNESGVTLACVNADLPIGLSHGGSIVKYPSEIVKRDGSGSSLEHGIELLVYAR